MRAFPRLVVALALRRCGLEGTRPLWLEPVRRSSSGVGLVLGVGLPDTVPEVVAAADRLAVAVGCPATVEPVAGSPRRCRLWLEEPAVDADVAGVGSAPLVTSVLDPLPLGRDPQDQVRGVRLWDPAGGRLLLVAGQPGSGKTHALRVLLEGLDGHGVATTVIDAKGGKDFRDLGKSLRLVDGLDASHALPVLRQLEAEVRARRAPTLHNYPWLPLLLVVDEWQNLCKVGSKTEQNEAAELLLRLVAMGRSVGLSVVLATQRPMAASVDTTVRGLVADRLLFAVGQDPHAASALGVPDAARLHPSRNRGQCYAVLEGDPPVLVRVFATTEEPV